MTAFANIVSHLANATFQTTLLVGCAAACALLTRRASAAVKHWIWSLGLIGALLFPILAEFAPSVEWSTPTMSRSQLSPVHAVLTVEEQTAHNGDDAAKEGAAQNAAPSLRTQSVTIWPLGLSLVWLCGVVVVLARLAAGLLAAQRIAGASVSFPEGPLADMATAACRTLSLRRPIDFRLVCSSEVVSVPLSWGGSHPVVVLPAGAEDWPTEQTRAALLHELAHVKRWDWQMQMLAQFACAVYWFHPLVWLAALQVRQEGETASDDLALMAGIGSAEYAEHLLGVARSAKMLRDTPVTALAMIGPSSLNRRIRAILSPHSQRNGRTPLMAAALGVVAIACTLVFAMIRPMTAVGEPEASPQAKSALHDLIVVIDAGLGGNDGKALAPNGMTEGALNLAMAQKVSAQLEKYGAQVSITRDNDVDMKAKEHEVGVSLPRDRGSFLKTNQLPPFAVSKHANCLINIYFWPSDLSQGSHGARTLITTITGPRFVGGGSGPGLKVLCNPRDRQIQDRVAKSFVDNLLRIIAPNALPTPRAVQVAVDYMTIPQLDFDKYSPQVPAGSNHDALLRDLLLRHGAKDTPAPAWSAADNGQSRVQPQRSSFLPQVRLMMVHPSWNKDGSITVQMQVSTVTQTPYIRGLPSQALRLLGAKRTFRDGQTLLIDSRSGGHEPLGKASLIFARVKSVIGNK